MQRMSFLNAVVIADPVNFGIICALALISSTYTFAWYWNFLSSLSATVTIAACAPVRETTMACMRSVRTDFFELKDFNKMFKASPGWKKAPNTPNALVETEYKRNLIDAKLKYIRETTLPSQQKRKVSGDTAEVERLLTVLLTINSNPNHSRHR
jgi:hypothetical protein